MTSKGHVHHVLGALADMKKTDAPTEDTTTDEVTDTVTAMVDQVENKEATGTAVCPLSFFEI